MVKRSDAFVNSERVITDFDGHLALLVEMAALRPFRTRLACGMNAQTIETHPLPTRITSATTLFGLRARQRRFLFR
jgi:hypothetical protein